MSPTSRLTLAALFMLGGATLAYAQDRDWVGDRQDLNWSRAHNFDRSVSPQSEYERGYRDANRRFREENGAWALDARSQDNWNTRNDRYRLGSQRGWGGSDSNQGYRRDEPRNRDTARQEQDRNSSGWSGGHDQADSSWKREDPDAASIRQHLRDSGFRSIRVLNAAYLVQAVTSSGQPVVMIIDPPGSVAGAHGSLSGIGQQATSENTKDFSSSFGRGQSSSRDGQSQYLDGVSKNAVRSKLQERGFTEISNLRSDGSTFVGSADWYGDRVDFRIDGRNGYIIEPSHITPHQVEAMLNEQGWDDIGNIVDAGPNYRVKASKDGSAYQLLIDARTGEITRRVAESTGDAESQNRGNVSSRGNASDLAKKTIPGQSSLSKILGNSDKSGQDDPASSQQGD